MKPDVLARQTRTPHASKMPTYIQAARPYELTKAAKHQTPHDVTLARQTQTAAAVLHASSQQA
eukprot:7432486-Pyramimonas_sp.AAC.1